MSDSVTEASFLRDVATHEMEVIKDDGLYRHIRFSRPNTSCMRFDFITWPGYLCYTGDMGTFVFSRIPDMLEFFRDSGHNFKDGRTLYINLSYWQEKLQADSVFGKGAEEWSDERFKEVLLKRVEEHFEETKPEDPDSEDPDDVEGYVADIDFWKKQKEWTLEEIEDDIFSLDNLQHDGFKAAMNFDSHGVTFPDLWDNDFMEYTFYFTWCCYALAWGVKKYDELNHAKEP